MSLLHEFTTTATDAVDAMRTKAASVVVDVRKQLPTVEPKKVQSAVVETAHTARKQVVDLTAPATKTLVDLTQRGEKLVRDLAGRSYAKPAAKSASASAATTPAATKPAARKPAAKKAPTKTTAAKRATKPATPSAE